MDDSSPGHKIQKVHISKGHSSNFCIKNNFLETKRTGDHNKLSVMEPQTGIVGCCTKLPISSYYDRDS